MLEHFGNTICLGKDVVILKEGERICGTGGAFSTVPIVQNKAYFQVDIQQTGMLFDHTRSMKIINTE